METLKPNHNGDNAFEDIKEEMVDDDDNFDSRPEYIENLGDTNPEEQYHKFLLTQQSNFEEALQKGDANDDEAENNEFTKKSSRCNDDLLEESFNDEAATDFSNNQGPKESSRNTFYPDQELNATKEIEEVEKIEPDNLFKKSISLESAKSKKSQNNDFNNSYSQDSEIADIQNQDEEKSSAHFGESQQFNIEQNKNSKAEMDFEKSMEFDHDQEYPQNDSFAKTIRSSSFEPKKSRSSSFSSSTRRLASSANFKKSSINNLNTFGLQSTNDFKYMGDQFKVGKINPNAISHTEQMFQKHYRKKLQYLYEPKYINYNVLQTSTDRSGTQTNDDKYGGIQFRMGKYASSALHDKNDGSDLTFEQKFQMMFKQKLNRLAPRQSEKCISYTDLKKMHENLLAKPYY